MKLIIFLATLFSIFLFSSIALADSFNDTFDTSSAWSNSTMFSRVGSPYEINPAGVMNVYQPSCSASDLYIHTTDGALTITKPFIFHIDVKYDTADYGDIILADSTGNKQLKIEFHFTSGSIWIYEIIGGSVVDYWNGYYSFSSGNWYNLTLIGTNPADLQIEGTHFLYFDSSNYTDFTYAFLGSGCSIGGSYANTKFDNLQWYEYTTTGYNQLEVGAFSPIEFDDNGCPKQLSGASISVYNGITGELLGTKTPTEIYEPNCCSSGNVTYGCYYAKFYVPKSYDYTYVRGYAPNYQNDSANFTFTYPSMFMNFWMMPINIFKYEGIIIDYDTLQPIANAMICPFLADNNTLSANCQVTSNIGAFSFYLYKDTPYYFGLTGPSGYECKITDNITITQNLDAVYYLRPKIGNFTMALTADKTVTTNATPVNFKVWMCGTSFIPELEFNYQTETGQAVGDSTVTMGKMGNPLFFSYNMKYCGDAVDTWIRFLERNYSSEYDLPTGIYAESNHLIITVNPPCVIPTFPTSGPVTPVHPRIPLNVTPLAPNTGIWFSPFFIMNILIIGVSAGVGFYLKSGIGFAVTITLLLLVMGFLGYYPLPLLYIFIIIAGLIFAYIIVKSVGGK
jgi:hypothetical protein